MWALPCRSCTRSWRLKDMRQYHFAKIGLYHQNLLSKSFLKICKLKYLVQRNLDQNGAKYEHKHEIHVKCTQVDELWRLIDMGHYLFAKIGLYHQNLLSKSFKEIYKFEHLVVWNLNQNEPGCQHFRDLHAWVQVIWWSLALNRCEPIPFSKN